MVLVSNMLIKKSFARTFVLYYQSTALHAHLFLEVNAGHSQYFSRCLSSSFIDQSMCWKYRYDIFIIVKAFLKHDNQSPAIVKLAFDFRVSNKVLFTCNTSFHAKSREFYTYNCYIVTFSHIFRERFDYFHILTLGALQPLI